MGEIVLSQRERVRQLNDAMRQSLGFGCLNGRIMFTAGVAALPPATRADVLQSVGEYCNFCDDDDPWGEHDFGAFEIDGQTYFWKIDYYDLTLQYHSEDKTDPHKTCRVLTIMLAEEY
jgi:hypothetical protein